MRQRQNKPFSSNAGRRDYTSARDGITNCGGAPGTGISLAVIGLEGMPLGMVNTTGWLEVEYATGKSP